MQSGLTGGRVGACQLQGCRRSSQRISVQRNALDHGIDLAAGLELKRSDRLSREARRQTNAAAVEADFNQAVRAGIERTDDGGKHVQRAEAVGTRGGDHHVAGANADPNRRADRKIEVRRLE